MLYVIDFLLGLYFMAVQSLKWEKKPFTIHLYIIYKLFKWIYRYRILWFFSVRLSCDEKDTKNDLKVIRGNMSHISRQ